MSAVICAQKPTTTSLPRRSLRRCLRLSSESTNESGNINTLRPTMPPRALSAPSSSRTADCLPLTTGVSAHSLSSESTESGKNNTLRPIMPPPAPSAPSSSRTADCLPLTTGISAHALSSSCPVADTANEISTSRPRHPIVSDKTEVAFPQRASGPAYTRTHSSPTIGPDQARSSPSYSKRPLRARAASSASTTMGRHRTRLPSILSLVLTQGKVPAQPREFSNDPELVGSFAPTSSPRPRLRSLLSGEVDFSRPPLSTFNSSPPHSTPHSRSSSASVPHRPRCRSDAPRARWASTIKSTSTGSPSLDCDNDLGFDPDTCPPASPDLPSICRTPSSYSGSGSGSDYEYFPTAPSSAGPPTPIHPATALPAARENRKSESSLHPVLERLEDASVFCVQTACAACGQRGTNFPRCPRCGEMWCSRACRLQNGNGKKHVCAQSSSGGQPLCM